MSESDPEQTLGRSVCSGLFAFSRPPAGHKVLGYSLMGRFLGGSMRRRQFITIVGGATAAFPFASLAQRQIPLVGFLNSASPETYRFNADSFREGLTKAGFVEGRNFHIVERWRAGTMAHCRPWRLNL